MKFKIHDHVIGKIEERKISGMIVNTSPVERSNYYLVIEANGSLHWIYEPNIEIDTQYYRDQKLKKLL
jgi:hypothetical protein